jgi:predicted CXXCH cytochrome family protein
MLNGKRYRLLLAFALLVVFLNPVSLYSLTPGESAHFDKNKLPKGCRSCHKGHGIFNTPMLPEGKDVFCFRCHGSNLTANDIKDEGYVAKNIHVADLRKEFKKPYRHPVENTGVHKHGENLPERDRSTERHSECVDCHHQHFAAKNNKIAGIKGVNAQGLTVQSIGSEYELCFKCHSTSANLPADQKNKADQFKISNPSYHPIVSQGKNHDVPSLIFPLTASSLIKCTHCHNNDDPSGPQGPHGSSFRHILKKNFTDSDGTEGPYQYELCYSCHRRESILGNESFFYHDLHISIVGASCRTCHNPHGSTQYSHLIDFDNLSVSPSSKGFIEYRSLGKRAGECYLQCHGKDHSPLSYPTKSLNSSSISTSRTLRR